MTQTQANIIAFPRQRIARPAVRKDPQLDLFRPGASVKGRDGTRFANRSGLIMETHTCPYTKTLLQVMVQWEYVRGWVSPADLIAVKLAPRARQ